MYHGSVCVALCVEPGLEIEGEREEKEKLLKSPRKREPEKK